MGKKEHTSDKSVRPDEGGKKYRPPKVFRKVYTRRKWDKKVAGQIYLPQDREFLEGLVQTVAPGDSGREKVRLDPEKAAALDKKGRKRLKGLAKAVKANRKGARISLILILIVLAGGAAGFELFWKDRLMETALERGLEQIFQARCDARGVDVSLLGGRVAVERLTLGDRARPMKNLAEIEGLRAAVSPRSLFRGSLRIDDLAVEGIQRNTDRDFPASLPGKREGARAGSGPAAAGTDGGGSGAGSDDASGGAASSLERMGAVLGEIDPKALLEEEKKNLASITLAEQSRQELEAEKETWQEEREQTEERLAAWGKRMDRLQGIQPSSVETIAGAQEALAAVQEAAEAAQEDSKAVREQTRQVRQSFQRWESRARDLRAAVEQDRQRLKGLIQSPAGEKASWVEDFLRRELAGPLGKYFRWYDRGRLWYGRFQSLQREDSAEAEAPERKKRRQGRNLPLAPPEEPRVALRQALLGASEPGLEYRIGLENITTEPALWPEPAGLEASWEGSRAGGGELQLAAGTGRGRAEGLSFDLGPSLKALGFSRMEGRFDLTAEITAAEGGRLHGQAEILVRDLSWSIPEPTELTALLEQTLEGAQPLPVTLSFRNLGGRKGKNPESVRIETPLPALLADQLKGLAEKKVAEARKRLSEEWDALAREKLGAYEKELSQAREIDQRAGEYRAKAEAYQQEIEDKKKALEKRIRKIRNQAAREAEKEAKKQADKVKENLPDFGF